ncbi:glutaredoxin family protein [Leucobacter chromiireducens]|uniref:Glutaredoxin family protein n=1 Tax=Leucobacter chromiireducens subsp. chromiireducens TaxID=660067 RepID=A0ABS1SKN1_9MICO|nr:glutaredoxin family protein [Leucobacter chromiireducens]MBL3688643.1 glutaredoxin family protein [Leucobacter chromiireducens subsp. chromiireducens]
MRTVQLTLIGKPGCHLCDDAREVIAGVRAELGARGIETSLEELDIQQDPALARKHSEHIPVVQIGGKRHAIWRVDPARLTAAVEKAARGPLGGLLR